MKKIIFFIAFCLISLVGFSQVNLHVRNLIFTYNGCIVWRLEVKSDTLFINNDTLFVQYTPGGGTITTIYQGTGMKNSDNPIVSVGTVSVDTAKVVMFNDTLTVGKMATKFENPWLKNGNDIYNTNSGNVGIGNPSPLFKLDVNGNIYGTISGGGSAVTGDGISGASGVSGYSDTFQGVYGQSTSGGGVSGISTSGTGVFGHSNTGFAGSFVGRTRTDTLYMYSKILGTSDTSIIKDGGLLKYRITPQIPKGDTTGEMLIWNNSTQAWQPTFASYLYYDQPGKNFYLDGLTKLWFWGGDSPYITEDPNGYGLYTNNGWDTYNIKIREKLSGVSDSLLIREGDTIKYKVVHNINTGTGTSGKLMKYTGTTTTGNSLITETGTTVSINGDFNYLIAHGVASADSMSPAYTPTVTQNVYTKINSSHLVVHDTTKITFAGDSVKVQTAGHYRIDFSITIAGTNNNQWRIKLFKNHVASVSSLGRFVMVTNGTSRYDTFGYFWYVTLSANDWLSFHITDLTNNDDPNISDYKVFITKMPEP